MPPSTRSLLWPWPVVWPGWRSGRREGPLCAWPHTQAAGCWPTHVLAPPLARKGSSPGPRGRDEPRWLCWALGHPQLDMCTLTPCSPHAKVASPTQTPMLAAPNLPAHQLPDSQAHSPTTPPALTLISGVPISVLSLRCCPLKSILPGPHRLARA